MSKLLKNAFLLARTAPRDLSAFWTYTKYLGFVRIVHWKKKTVPMLFQDVVRRTPNTVMLTQDNRTWTYKEAEEFTNRAANYFKANGLKAGDDVALMMENRPEMVLLWLGLSKIGVTTALINTSLRKSTLKHCITTVNTKAIICSPATAEHVVEIKDDLLKERKHVQFFCYGPPPAIDNKAPAIEDASKLSSASNASPDFRGKLNDPLLYVYTSGTTGLPKAALLRHSRFILTSAVPVFLAGVTKKDVQYIHMPLYHTSAGILGVSQAIVHGIPAVIASKFSASTFWEECIKHNCTVTQYIGEICRYLYSQPEKETDRKHPIRLIYGNGLRPHLWTDFSRRFGVSNIKELYGASESNGNLMNLDNKPGAVGCIPTICRLFPRINSLLFHRFLIKVDPETGVPLRNEKGLCILVEPNEPGEYVSEIVDSRPECQFDGYSDPEATSKKVYKDVIHKGDRCFASGDILLYDDDGYVFFKDRTGDTFRWKGENVSTAEVEAVISKHANHADCVVIGVQLPHSEGKAGMAIILDPEARIDLDGLLHELRQDLPSFAIPLFVRLTNQLDTTGTYKLPKARFITEAYDITKVRDPVYFLDPRKKKFVRFDGKLNEELEKNLIPV